MKRVRVIANRTGPKGEPIRVPISATIAHSITRKALSEVVAWRASLEIRGAEDANWHWPSLLKEFRKVQQAGLGRYEYLVLRCQHQVQALAILETAHHVSRVTLDPLLYVEYIANAPWNRPDIGIDRRFSGCGKALIRVAAERSLELGLGGIIGLHSLPGARDFYRASGLKDFGPDDREHGLHYFELNA